MGTSVILSPGGIIRLSGALVWDNVIERCYSSVEASKYSDPSLGCLSKENTVQRSAGIYSDCQGHTHRAGIDGEGHGIGIATILPLYMGRQIDGLGL